MYRQKDHNNSVNHSNTKVKGRWKDYNFINWTFLMSAQHSSHTLTNMAVSSFWHVHNVNMHFCLVTIVNAYFWLKHPPPPPPPHSLPQDWWTSRIQFQCPPPPPPPPSKKKKKKKKKKQQTHNFKSGKGGGGGGMGGCRNSYVLSFYIT